MSDKGFLNDILLACSRGATRLFRQNVGVGWIGQVQRASAGGTVVVRPGDVILRNARAFHAGLKGQGDLLGWTSVVVTEEMVGTTVAIFTSLEAKAGRDKSSPEQVNWRTQIQQAGGIAAEVRSVDEAVTACQLHNAKRGDKV